LIEGKPSADEPSFMMSHYMFWLGSAGKDEMLNSWSSSNVSCLIIRESKIKDAQAYKDFIS